MRGVLVGEETKFFISFANSMRREREGGRKGKKITIKKTLTMCAGGCASSSRQETTFNLLPPLVFPTTTPPR